MKKHYLFSIVLVFSLLMTGYMSIPAYDNGPKIKFSHKLHVAEAEAECSVCHESVNESTLASDKNLPSHEQCMTCHDDLEEEGKCKMCHADPDNPEALPNPERPFKFNHAYHINTEEMQCDACHKGVEKMDLAYKKALPKKAVCIGCHSSEIEIQVCQRCHTDVTEMLPKDHIGQWKLTHKMSARLNEKECSVCHTNDYCQECHSGGKLIGLAHSEKLSAAISPANAGKSKQILARMHGLNYIALHPQDAKMKMMNCATCHEEKLFCQECHEASGAKPVWHSGAGWGAIAGAVGTGGGKHAELAKKDITACASCHDVEGNDPVCLMCHRDANVGRGNDPKTHKTGKYKNMHGPWHDDPEFVCYNCHSSGFKKGTGFCGYCHN